MFSKLKDKLKDWTKKIIEDKEEEVIEKKEEKKGFFQKLFSKENAEETPTEKIEEEIKEIPKNKNIEEKIQIPENKKLQTEKEPTKEKEQQTEKKEEKKSFFKKILTGTIKTSEEEFNNYSEELEMLLLENNVAFEVTEKVLEELKEKLVGKEIPKKELEPKIKKRRTICYFILWN